ncbi:MAG: SGNH/GDSL hydrolase family protein [Clostridia bacterium]|nr:SGNH/GDSL hydrolase family protein [Clostridia bacterium]
MKTILFQGDSITDCGRDRGNDANLGNGYPRLIEASLGFDMPGQYRFVNRAVSGDRVPDVYARIVRDVLSVRPDVLSLLVGVNDIWHGLDGCSGTGTARFEKVYDLFLDEVTAELPGVKLLLLEPFLLPGTATNNRDGQPDRFSVFDSGVKELAAIVRSLADRYGAVFVPLQGVFDAAALRAEPSYWLADGVHPTAKGHALICREWLKAFATPDV